MTPTTKGRGRGGRRGPGIEGTSSPERPAVACVGGPYDRMWWWLDDWTALVATAELVEPGRALHGIANPALDYALTAKQVVNPVDALDGLVGQVADYTPRGDA